MFGLRARGDYRKTKDFIKNLKDGKELSDLDRYGQMGVEALRNATPKDTGRTADSWAYRITQEGIWKGIEWYNTNQTEDGGPSVAILIQYGHATRSGSYVLGYDYINPAMDEVFNFIVDDVWKKVTA